MMNNKKITQKQIDSFISMIDNGILDVIESSGEWGVIEKIKEWSKVAKFNKPKADDKDVSKLIELHKKKAFEKLAGDDPSALENIVESIKEIDEGRWYRSVMTTGDVVTAYSERCELGEVLYAVLDRMDDEDMVDDIIENVELTTGAEMLADSLLSKYDERANRERLMQLMELRWLNQSADEVINELRNFI